MATGQRGFVVNKCQAPHRAKPHDAGDVVGGQLHDVWEHRLAADVAERPDCRCAHTVVVIGQNLAQGVDRLRVRRCQDQAPSGVGANGGVGVLEAMAHQGKSFRAVHVRQFADRILALAFVRGFEPAGEPLQLLPGRIGFRRAEAAGHQQRPGDAADGERYKKAIPRSFVPSQRFSPRQHALS